MNAIINATELIFEAIDNYNLTVIRELHIEKDLNIILMGENSIVDSFGLISLIVTIEDILDRRFNIKIILLDDNFLCGDDSPYSSVGSLVSHLNNLLQKQ